MRSQRPSKALNIALWTVQALLSATLLWSATLKLFQPIAEMAAMWPWAGQVSPALVKFTGLVDALGALGLVLPGLLRIRPGLTPLAALGVLALMVCAAVFHILRGEASSIGVNVVVALLAGFVAWGRWGQQPAARSGSPRT